MLLLRGTPNPLPLPLSPDACTGAFPKGGVSALPLVLFGAAARCHACVVVVQEGRCSCWPSCSSLDRQSWLAQCWLRVTADCADCAGCAGAAAAAPSCDCSRALSETAPARALVPRPSSSPRLPIPHSSSPFWFLFLPPLTQPPSHLPTRPPRHLVWPTHSSLLRLRLLHLCLAALYCCWGSRVSARRTTTLQHRALTHPFTPRCNYRPHSIHLDPVLQPPSIFAF